MRVDAVRELSISLRKRLFLVLSKPRGILLFLASSKDLFYNCGLLRIRNGLRYFVIYYFAGVKLGSIGVLHSNGLIDASEELCFERKLAVCGTISSMQNVVSTGALAGLNLDVNFLLDVTFVKSAFRRREVS